MNFVMAVRDYRELAQGPFELVPFDQEFDMARAVKSEEELVEVRDAMDIIRRRLLGAGCGLQAGQDRSRNHGAGGRAFLCARRRSAHDEHSALRRARRGQRVTSKFPAIAVVAADDLLLYSLEVTGAGGYWVEFSRA